MIACLNEIFKMVLLDYAEMTHLGWKEPRENFGVTTLRELLYFFLRSSTIWR